MPVRPLAGKCRREGGFSVVHVAAGSQVEFALNEHARRYALPVNSLSRCRRRFFRLGRDSLRRLYLLDTAFWLLPSAHFRDFFRCLLGSFSRGFFWRQKICDLRGFDVM